MRMLIKLSYLKSQRYVLPFISPPLPSVLGLQQPSSLIHPPIIIPKSVVMLSRVLVTRNALRTGSSQRAAQPLLCRFKGSRPASPNITMIPPQPRAQADPALQKWSDDDPGHDVQGPGHGKHTKRTLASLSMDGKVCVVTGAGRGLGNMMARTFVESYVKISLSGMGADDKGSLRNRFGRLEQGRRRGCCQGPHRLVR